MKPTSFQVNLSISWLSFIGTNIDYVITGFIKKKDVSKKKSIELIEGGTHNILSIQYRLISSFQVKVINIFIIIYRH